MLIAIKPEPGRHLLEFLVDDLIDHHDLATGPQLVGDGHVLISIEVANLKADVGAHLNHAPGILNRLAFGALKPLDNGLAAGRFERNLARDNDLNRLDLSHGRGRAHSRATKD